MKLKHKKIIISSTAVFIAGILAVGTLLQSSVSVQASNVMMPGVETIVSETSETNPFRILEIVDDTKEAEIGYYVSGQEPYFKLYKYDGSGDVQVDETGNKIDYEKFTSVEDVLSKLPTSVLRRDFMQNTKEDTANPGTNIDAISDENMTELTGIKNIRSICGDDGPLSYQPYQETYFPTEEQGEKWNRIDLVTTRTEKLKGTYIKSETGVGDYQREELSFYPVREGTEDSNKETAKYVENIDGFAYGDAGQTQPYKVEFTGINEVTQDIINSNYENGKGLYTNVYGYLNRTTTPNNFNRFPGELSGIIKSEADIAQEQVDVQDEFQSGAQLEDMFTDDSSFSSEEMADEDLFSSVGNTVSESNPMIYRDEEIDIFPFHQYYPIGTYNEIIEQLKYSNAPDFQWIDGTIYEDIDSNYYYWDAETDTAQRLVYVIGREKQPYSNTQAIPATDAIPYYYYVSAYELACKTLADGDISRPENYEYYGWYYALNPENEDRYIEKTDGEKADFYSSDDEFRLAPGMGEYNFKPDDAENEKDVQVRSFYYTGGYTNHDWMKQYVFNLLPETNGVINPQFDNFAIEVDTTTTGEFESKYSTGIPINKESQQSEDIGLLGDGEEVFPENGAEFQDESFVSDVGETNDGGISAGEGEVNDTDSNDSLPPNQEFENIDTPEMGEESAVEPLISETQEDIDSFTAAENENDDLSEQWSDGENASEVLGDGEENDSFYAPEEIDALDSADVNNIFTSGDAAITNELAKYDLIYINGKLSEEAAQVLAQGAASKDYACIINQDKVFDNDGISKAFSSYAKPDDADLHYVTQNVYFFNNINKNVAGNTLMSSLINLEFHTHFNFEDSNLMEGFEEILEYIETENQYRLLGTPGSVNSNELFSDEGGELFTDESTAVTSGVTELSDGTKLLDTYISQARAIEYIINYKYKRPEKIKDKINVLEIEPGKSDKQLSAGKIGTWLTNTVGFANANACCYRQGEGEKKSILDNNRNTIWANNLDQFDKHEHAFWVEIVGKPSLLKGVVFTPRQDEKYVGYPIKYKIEILDQGMKNVLETYSGELVYNKNTAKKDIEIKFKKRVPKSAKYVKFYFEEAHSQDGMKVVAACAEFLPIIDDSASKAPEITVSSMTSSEYVGHIEDINSKYDLIYIGDNLKEHNKFINGDNPEMLYTHVGGTILAYEDGAKKNKLQYLGLLDTEYEFVDKDKKWYYTAKIKGQQSKDIYYSKRFKPVSEYNDGTNGQSGTGSFKGSGNDITNQQYEELMDFVKSGYPVVLGETLVTLDDGKKVISSNKVDKSSYFYQFMNEAINYPNVIWEKELENEESNIFFFSNLSKPEIVFSKENGKPLEPPRNGEKNNSQLGDVGYVDGKLQYTFTIKDDAVISPANTTYDCRLYLDLDFDGNLSDLEEQEKYIEIRNENGEVVSQTKYGEADLRYQLKAGEQYTLIRNLPEDYFKIITWKLEISNNLNTYIRTSEIGYAKQRGDDSNKQIINVLQIRPNDGEQVAQGAAFYGTWDLSKSETFLNLISDIEDFSINVKVMQINEYANYEKNTGKSLQELLDNTQIVILGFDDSYKNIPNDSGQVDKLLDFIRSGKSVIFSHDTTSYINWDYEEFYNKVARNAYDEMTGKGELDVMGDSTWLWQNAGNPKWGLSLNKVLRSIVGMDRYGIVTGESSDKLSDKGKMTVADLLRRGKGLQDGEVVTYGDTQETVSFARLKQLAGDVAYVTGDEARNTSYPQTHGYSNIQLEPVDFGLQTTQTVTKVNDGAITQYPYRMGKTITSVASTHAQDLQLALERDRDINGISDGRNDIVVWYCLGGNNYYYGGSPNDVRNYYYFYSKGNVIYTGAGHRNVNNEEEIKLFVNAIVAAANVTAVQPEVSFIKNLNPAAEVESVRYYMTDGLEALQNESNVLEKDMEFYFNIKDYNMVSATLSGNNQQDQEMTVEFYIEDENGDTEFDGLKLKPITQQIQGLVPYGEPDRLISARKEAENKPWKFYLDKNNAYGLQIKGIESYLRNGGEQSSGQYKSNLRLYIKATSTVTIFGKTSDKSSWAVLDLKQRQLFDLD